MQNLDETHKHEGASLAIKASSKIVELSCFELRQPRNLPADFELYWAQMGDGGHKLTHALGVEQLKNKLRHMKELDATFALHSAMDPTDLDALIAAIERRLRRRPARSCRTRRSLPLLQQPPSVTDRRARARARVVARAAATPQGRSAPTATSPAIRPTTAGPTRSFKDTGKGPVPPPALACAAASSAPTQDALARMFAEYLTKMFGGL